jgi:hypothetical protein
MVPKRFRWSEGVDSRFPKLYKYIWFNPQVVITNTYEN